jgi:uncharacterized protein YciI
MLRAFCIFKEKMKSFFTSAFFILLLAFFLQPVYAQNKQKAGDDPAGRIEQFWLVVLKTGKKDVADSAERAKLFEGHMNNIVKLYNEGVLKVAGPFGKNDFKWRGLFIFDCKTKEEVEKLVATDPAVAAGIFDVDIVPWYAEPIGSFKHGKPDKPSN